jgi:O-antigen/teichoic acid export membrane protein
VISTAGTALTIGWLNQAILRNAGNRALAYETLDRRTRAVLEAVPVITVVPLAVLAGAMLPTGPDRWIFLLVATVGVLTTARYQVRQTLAQRDGRAGAYAVAETLRASAALLLSLVFAAAHLMTPWSLVAAHAAAYLLALAVLRTPFGPDPARAVPDGAVVRRYWRFGWPLSLWFATSFSVLYLDRFVISSLYGLERAGHYAAAADLVVRGMGLLVAPAIMFMHPTFMRAWNTEDRAAAIRTWRRMTVLLTAGTAVAAVAAVAVYAAAAHLLLADPLALPPFAVLAAGGAAWQLALMIHKPLEATDRTQTMLLALLLSLLASAALHTVLAPRLEELGVALGFATGAAVYIALCLALDAHVIRPAEQLEGAP